MKKFIGFFAMVAIAFTVFATTKSVNRSSNVDLASLTSINTANAECQGLPNDNDGWCQFDYVRGYFTCLDGLAYWPDDNCLIGLSN